MSHRPDVPRPRQGEADERASALIIIFLFNYIYLLYTV